MVKVEVVIHRGLKNRHVNLGPRDAYPSVDIRVLRLELGEIDRILRKATFVALLLGRRRRTLRFGHILRLLRGDIKLSLLPHHEPYSRRCYDKQNRQQDGKGRHLTLLFHGP